MSLRPWKSVMHHSLNWLTQVPCFFFRVSTTDRWDWAALRAQIAQHGVRNSLLVAPMPTASTAQILGAKPANNHFTQMAACPWIFFPFSFSSI